MLAEDGIHWRKATIKPLLSEKQGAKRLEFCLAYRYLDWREVIFTDESYFETGAFRKRRTWGVLRHANEEYRPQNMDRKFQGGATVMFLVAMLYGQDGSVLPYHIYRTPYETDDEKCAAEFILDWEYIEVQQKENCYYSLGLEPPHQAERQTRKMNWKGGIDWFIYWESILNPLLFPFVCAKMQQQPGVLIMEDNAPAHNHYYHDQARAKLGLTSLLDPLIWILLRQYGMIWRIRSRHG